MIRKTFIGLVITLLFVTSMVAEIQSVKVAEANPEGSIPRLSMPVEYVNYTITNVDGSLWTKIDGDYTISLVKEMDCSFNGDLPMLYPMPPQSTNIIVSLDGKEIGWSNYTQFDPEALHHTAIGDWWMIYSNLENVSGNFELKIHYEHPIETVNGSTLFLYDLNISPYLSVSNPKSTAYFTVTFLGNAPNVHVFTTPSDGVLNPVDFSSKTQTQTSQVNFTITSEYSKPLLGDIIVSFNADSLAKPFDGTPVALTVVAIACVGCGILFYRIRRKSRSAFL